MDRLKGLTGRDERTEFRRRDRSIECLLHELVPECSLIEQVQSFDDRQIDMVLIVTFDVIRVVRRRLELVRLEQRFNLVLVAQAVSEDSLEERGVNGDVRQATGPYLNQIHLVKCDADGFDARFQLVDIAQRYFRLIGRRLLLLARIIVAGCVQRFILARQTSEKILGHLSTFRRFGQFLFHLHTDVIA